MVSELMECENQGLECMGQTKVEGGLKGTWSELLWCEAGDKIFLIGPGCGGTIHISLEFDVLSWPGC